ncbi:MAG: hypothetical protein QOE83_548 [Actinomycetota bacterium]|nr:hypothetical protein [Actinomycetota bacterium]
MDLGGVGMSEPRRWSPARLLAFVVLAAWGALFWFMLLGGRSSLYLSNRTRWLVPTGAILLTLAALGRLASARTAVPRPANRSDGRVAALMLVPVVVLFALPPATLGAYAASRRSVTSGGGVSAADISSGAITYFDIASALGNREAMQALTNREGEQIVLEGFVTNQEGDATGEFFLTRFLITCCVADATATEVRVVDAPPGGFPDNQWVRVTGAMYPVGADVLIDAASVETIPRPADPYLSG